MRERLAERDQPKVPIFFSETNTRACKISMTLVGHQACHMLPKIRIVVTPEKFDDLFNEDAQIAEFSSPAEEEAYERRDAFLIHLIKKLVAEQFGSDADRTPHIVEDWWPNHTRYLEMVPRQCSKPFLQSLHELLTDEFANYRVQICVYENMFKGSTYIGSMVIYADRIVIESALSDRLDLG